MRQETNPCRREAFQGLLKTKTEPPVCPCCLGAEQRYCHSNRFGRRGVEQRCCRSDRFSSCSSCLWPSRPSLITSLRPCLGSYPPCPQGRGGPWFRVAGAFPGYGTQRLARASCHGARPPSRPTGRDAKAPAISQLLGAFLLVFGCADIAA